MNRFLITVAIALALSGCAKNEDVAKVESEVRTKLVDADSARFSNVEFYNLFGGTFVCGNVRAKGQVPGYDDLVFQASIKDGQIAIDSLPADIAESVYNAEACKYLKSYSQRPDVSAYDHERAAKFFTEYQAHMKDAIPSIVAQVKSISQ